MSEARPRGRYAKGIRRRQEILDRALEVFAERGAAGTSLRAIAAQIGFEHSAIKNYFSSLEDLKLAVVLERDARAAEALAHDERPTIRDQFQATAEKNLQVPGLIALYTSLLAAAVEPTNELAREHIAQRFANGRAILVEAIEEGRRTGATPPGGPAEAIATLVLAAFDGIQVQWLLDPSIDLPAVLALLDPLLGAAPSPLAAPQEAQQASTPAL
ncbi:TetR/AcrR family transcriptional regulator [Rathayibacter caricis DSM 15933]|uniref:TetR/AcrR family transcriptional regulator n=1 Tax=Rathayibacter caricis DSM 15933 TaxID=1328867 RepID=A0A2T4UQW6_9MICO|nr:TetR/AcrR family transcriptional regulator [Rathayibacter caricis]PTL71903.1 TetR/AcrR family transcriptional regulator [Rathayibacter caricis DSM 15933]